MNKKPENCKHDKDDFCKWCCNNPVNGYPCSSCEADDQHQERLAEIEAEDQPNNWEEEPKNIHVRCVVCSAQFRTAEEKPHYVCLCCKEPLADCLWVLQEMYRKGYEARVAKWVTDTMGWKKVKKAIIKVLDK